MKKGGILILCTLFFITLMSSGIVSASLGISPGSIHLNFEGGDKAEISYSVFSDDIYKNIALSVEGELAQYFTIDKDSLAGRGSFIVSMNLPQTLNITPGTHAAYITAKEVIEEHAQMIGTSVNIRSGIYVFIPYPGKYIDASLNIPNVNIGENIPITIGVNNRGTDNLIVSPNLIIYDDAGKEITRVSFAPYGVNRGGSEDFKKNLDASNFKPGSYFAKATIEYGSEKPLEINTTFKIGNLNVVVLNFTQNVTAGEINKFIIKIKSNWNDKIESAYANVNIFNDNESYTFGTSPENLAPWEEKELSGYLDAKEMKAGNYSTEIRLNYQGQTTYASGSLIVLGESIGMIWIISGGVLLGIILIMIIIYIILKFKNSKKNRRK